MDQQSDDPTLPLRIPLYYRDHGYFVTCDELKIRGQGEIAIADIACCRVRSPLLPASLCIGIALVAGRLWWGSALATPAALGLMVAGGLVCYAGWGVALLWIATHDGGSIRGWGDRLRMGRVCRAVNAAVEAHQVHQVDEVICEELNHDSHH